MSRPDEVQAAIDRLATSGASLRCKDVEQLLRGLGFDVREGKKAGHRVVSHPELVDFTGTNFTCGHGRNPEIKPAYVKSLRKVLESHADALRELRERSV